MYEYLDDDRQLIQHLVNEYLLEGSNDILELIRTCPNEYFEVILLEKNPLFNRVVFLGISGFYLESNISNRS